MRLFLSREKCKSPISPPTPARKHGMPHDLLHAHPFYDDRPLLDGVRLSPPNVNFTRRDKLKQTPLESKTPRFELCRTAVLRQSCNLIFTLCYSTAASLQQSTFNYMCTKFKATALGKSLFELFSHTSHRVTHPAGLSGGSRWISLVCGGCFVDSSVRVLRRISVRVGVRDSTWLI